MLLPAGTSATTPGTVREIYDRRGFGSRGAGEFRCNKRMTVGVERRGYRAAMSGLSAALTIPILLLVIALPVLIVFVIVPAMRRRDEAVKDEARTVPTLRYHVPGGQDPAAVAGALEAEGYAVTFGDTTEDVIIPCRSGAERERAHVRAVIAHASLNLEGDVVETPVRFADEPADGGRA